MIQPPEQPELLRRTRVVLHHPFFPENVGSVARSMRNMGLTELHVAEGVSPRHENAYKLAVGAPHVLDGATHHDALEPALAGATLVIGTTSHLFGELTAMTPRAAAVLARGHQGPVAIVFGNEKNGLALNELRRCDVVVRIPCLVPDASLNLAQAATIICYEWMLAAVEGGPPDPLAGWPALAPDDELERFADRLEQALASGGFLKGHVAAKRTAALRRMLARLRLEPDELALLQGVLRRLRWYFERGNK